MSCLEDLVEAHETGRPTLGHVELAHHITCLSYTSDAADDLTRVVLVGSRNTKKKEHHNCNTNMINTMVKRLIIHSTNIEFKHHLQIVCH